MDVILHLGGHRTGVTTFQHFLRENTGALEQQGLAVWTAKETRSGMYSELVRRPEAITEQIERKGRRSVGVIRVLQECLEDDGFEQLLVSEPNMIGTIENNIKTGRLYPFLTERLERFSPAYRRRCKRIILSVRSYDRYWASVLAYAVARGRKMPDASMLDRLVTQPLRWQRVVEEVASVFPRAELVVLPFEAFAALPERLLSVATGLPTQITDGLGAAREWKERAPGTQRLARALEPHDRDGAARMAAFEAGRWMPFAPHQSDVMRLQYEEDLAWLRDGAAGLATLIGRADFDDPHIPDDAYVRGRRHDREENARRLG